jgi:hypothetical protein
MQIHLIETFKGVGFLSAATVMCEVGDFSVFKSPKQLFALAKGLVCYIIFPLLLFTIFFQTLLDNS